MKTKNTLSVCEDIITKKEDFETPILVCQYCGGELRKNGKDRNGNSRLRCKICQKYFSLKDLNSPSLSFEKNILHAGLDYLRINIQLFPNDEILKEHFQEENTPELGKEYFRSDGLTINEEQEMENTFNYEQYKNLKKQRKWKKSYNVDFSVLNTKENSESFPHDLLSRLIPFLDSDNASEADVWFLGTLFQVSKNKDFFSFNHEGEKFFSFRVVSEQEKKITKLELFSTYLHFDFYGTFFCLGRMKIFNTEQFLLTFGMAFQQKKVSRVDYAMDFKDLSVGNTASHYFSEFVPSDIRPNKDGDFKTIAYCDHSTIKNKKAFLRIYDKLLEARDRKRERLYMDYFAFEKVTRFEVEFRSSILQDFQFEFDWIFDEKKLLGMVKTWTNNQFKKFDFDFENIHFVERTRKDGEKATAKYFLPRYKTLMTRLYECGLTAVELAEYYHGATFEEYIAQCLSDHQLKKKDPEEFLKYISLGGNTLLSSIKTPDSF
ncbi:MAG: hypothetical protein WCJ84_05555 [Candidatus Peregrinibacteria bacterium]